MSRKLATRWRAALVAAAAVVALAVGVSIASGGRDCLSAEDLAGGGFRVTSELPADAADEARAQEVARANIVDGEVRGAKFVRLATQADQAGQAMYLVSVVRDDEPHPIPAGPVDAPPVMVTAPCSVVAVSPDGDYLFTYTLQEPVP